LVVLDALYLAQLRVESQQLPLSIFLEFCCSPRHRFQSADADGADSDGHTRDDPIDGHRLDEIENGSPRCPLLRETEEGVVHVVAKELGSLLVGLLDEGVDDIHRDRDGIDNILVRVCRRLLKIQLLH